MSSSSHPANNGIPLIATDLNSTRVRRLLIIGLGGRIRLKTRGKLTLALLIFAVSFSVKALVAVDLSPVMHTTAQVHGGMALRYHRDAVSIVEGRGLLVPDNWDSSDTQLLARPPGYPIYLSAIYATLGKSYFNVQLVQQVLNSISPILIFLIAGRLLSWPVGVGTGLLAAVSHHLSYYSSFVLPDSICALPILLAIYLLVKTEHGTGRRWWVYAFAGLMIGLSVWLRPNSMLMGLFLAVMLTLISVRRRQVMKRAWLLAMTPFLVIAPITIRNYLIFREFIPISINTGIVLWEGIADGGGESFGAVGNDVLVAEQEAALYNDPRYAESWSTPDGIKRDRERMRKSLWVIASHPIWFAGTMIRKMADMLKYSAEAPLVFRATDTELVEAGADAKQVRDKSDEQEGWMSVRENSRLRSIAFGESIRWTRPLVRAVQRIAKETMLLFVLLGGAIVLFLSARRWLYIMMVPLYYLLIQSTMHTEFRYTLPMQYFLFSFAAVVWVLLGFVAWHSAKLLARRRPKADKEVPSVV
ncbi:MAG TPA: glycosyltransferase family 39 protein [Blastocatellia bacterium]|nr:glycosyltransferase family 39 protein [Blastocatellia bacterium]